MTKKKESTQKALDKYSANEDLKWMSNYIMEDRIRNEDTGKKQMWKQISTK